MIQHYTKGNRLTGLVVKASALSPAYYGIFKGRVIPVT